MGAALSSCKALYALGRSDEALPLARCALSQARRLGDSKWVHHGLTACGILASDCFDVVAGVEFHLQSLRLAVRERDDIQASNAWSNIGLALSLAGNPPMAIAAYGRAIDAVARVQGPVYARYAAFINRSDSLFQLGQYDEGLDNALRALNELTPDFAAMDRQAVILLLRNLVNLLVAAGRLDEAGRHVEELTRLAADVASPRAFIAVAIARASYELATGQHDVAFTRLDQALEKARATPQALRDTLVCVMRAEEIAGSPERALARLQELSQHHYEHAIEKARRNMELAALGDELSLAEHFEQQTQARLLSRLDRPDAPGGWEALRKLAINAAFRVDATGLHGERVGALTRALALACNEPPLRALEIGLAAELHDIGLLSVPETLCLRKGPLSASERKAYLRHTEAGAAILRDGRHPRLLLASEVAAYHHAWWNGDGYPARVRGRSIPAAARMCAVADAYAEILCGFQNAGLPSMHDALAALAARAGTQLEPDLVDRFKSVVRAESAHRGIDIAKQTGITEFQGLIETLQEDRGFI